jgi:hypothetical protein
MRESNEVVKSSKGDQWEFSMSLPTTLEEAIELYTKEGALFLLNSGLKVKKQGIARDGFRQGKSREEVEQLVEDYRPGGGSSRSKKDRALDLIMDKANDLSLNPELKREVQGLFKKNDFQAIIDKLEALDVDDE